ncbi:MAG: Na/Pi cotransporter family protein [Termitinemataceae bacterium]|nr:MAG: Na/Pi cotransporter family protein [Termitinemataceae bacterium]
MSVLRVMTILNMILSIGGSLALFLFGMKVMSDGIQQGAGGRLQSILGLMTGNRFTAVFTGAAVTALIQSSGATTVMVVSFVNSGMMTLTQAIGVIMGANIGTTVTAWIVSLVGFSLNISTMAIPLIGLGFLMRALKWKYQEIGNAVLGFGILFLGLDFLTRSMPIISAENLAFIASFKESDFLYILLCALVGLVTTVIMHSSSASTAIMLTMAHSGILDFRTSCVMVLGANIGSCIDAVLAAIGTKTNAKRTAVVHVLFNIIGVVLAIPFLNPLLKLVLSMSPENIITAQIAMFHTVFNILSTVIFLPFVNQFATFVCFIAKDKDDKDDSGEVKKIYKLEYTVNSMRETPEFSVYRAKNEIQAMAGMVHGMYCSLHQATKSLRIASSKEETVKKLVSDNCYKEEYADQMREQLTTYLMECTRKGINKNTEHNVALMLRIVADLEDITDDCYSISLLLERSVRKNQIFKPTELDALDPYMHQVEVFLVFVQEHLGRKLTKEEADYANSLEEEINAVRNKLRKLGRKRIEEGADVKTELLFIDLVRRVERLGDFCYSISASMSHMV